MSIAVVPAEGLNPPDTIAKMNEVIVAVNAAATPVEQVVDTRGPEALRIVWAAHSPLPVEAYEATGDQNTYWSWDIAGGTSDAADGLTRFELPSSFSDWAAAGVGAPISVLVYTEDTSGDANIDFTIYRNGTSTYTATAVKSATSATWYSKDFARADIGADDWVAGDILGIAVSMNSQDGIEARLGPITLRWVRQLSTS